MKRSLFGLQIFGLVFLCCSVPAKAEVGDIPKSRDNTIQVRPSTHLYAHPVDYWWHKNPSMTGSWDYFTPVKYFDEPVQLSAPVRRVPGRSKNASVLLVPSERVEMWRGSP